MIGLNTKQWGWKWALISACSYWHGESAAFRHLCPTVYLPIGTRELKSWRQKTIPANVPPTSIRIHHHDDPFGSIDHSERHHHDGHSESTTWWLNINHHAMFPKQVQKMDMPLNHLSHAMYRSSYLSCMPLRLSYNPSRTPSSDSSCKCSVDNGGSLGLTAKDFGRIEFFKGLARDQIEEQSDPSARFATFSQPAFEAMKLLVWTFFPLRIRSFVPRRFWRFDLNRWLRRDCNCVLL